MENQRYNFWTVIKEIEGKLQPNGARTKRFLCQCDCGKLKEVNKFSLTSGRSLSCGCIKGKHRLTNTRLYHCWENMKQRSRLRTQRGEQCSIFADWLNFLGFRSWALNNGYQEDLILLRGTETLPDVGDYEPSNVRWGTKSQNYIDYLNTLT